MQKYYHKFHIPVMGTGHSSDTPIRVAHLGISSVVSLVDDLLLEKLRKYYAEKFSLPYQRIPKSDEDGRAKRITAYLNTVQPCSAAVLYLIMSFNAPTPRMCRPRENNPPSTSTASRHAAPGFAKSNLHRRAG